MIGDIMLVGFLLLVVLLVAFEDNIDSLLSRNRRRPERFSLERRESDRRKVVYMNQAWPERRAGGDRRHRAQV